MDLKDFDNYFIKFLIVLMRLFYISIFILIIIFGINGLNSIFNDINEGAPLGLIFTFAIALASFDYYEYKFKKGK